MGASNTQQMYAVISASADAIASIRIPRAARIIGVLWSIRATSAVADADELAAELSLQSTRQVTTNDAQQIISAYSIGEADGPTPASMHVPTFNFWHPADVDVNVLDFIYLHATAVGSTTWATRILLQLSRTR